MGESELVGLKHDGDGVEIVVLRHPPVNALSTGLLADLEHRFGEIESESDGRCVILTGDGPYFTAGADLKEVARIGVDDAPKVVAQGQALFSRIEKFRLPVLAAINGLALGGGLELALSCDLRIAGDSAKLGAPETVYGLMPAYGGTQRLPRLIGAARAKELIFTGSMISAADALKLGLVNKTVPAGQELRAARDLAHTIAQRAPKAVASAKRAIREGMEGTLAEGLSLEAELFRREVLPSEDLAEGLASFLERRPAKFKGA